MIYLFVLDDSFTGLEIRYLRTILGRRLSRGINVAVMLKYNIIHVCVSETVILLKRH